MTLKKFPTPEKIIEKDIESIVSCWRSEVYSAVGKKKAISLVKAAEESIGKRQGIKMAEYEIRYLLERYDINTKQKEEIEKKTFANKVSGAREMLEIKGVGVNTVEAFISEVGDIKNYEQQ